MGNSKGFLYGLMIAGIIALVAGIFAWVFMYLWNWLIPDLFNGPVLGYWQALGLLVLSKMIFGGFGTGHKRHHWKQKHSHWKHKWQEQCGSMTPEEKEKWKNHFMNKWNCNPTDTSKVPTEEEIQPSENK